MGKTLGWSPCGGFCWSTKSQPKNTTTFPKEDKGVLPWCSWSLPAPLLPKHARLGLSHTSTAPLGPLPKTPPPKHPWTVQGLGGRGTRGPMGVAPVWGTGEGPGKVRYHCAWRQARACPKSVGCLGVVNKAIWTCLIFLMFDV